jgi:hypothetical protein
MKVYLDDERATPDGWTRVYWPSEAIELLKSGQVTEISLDHDLGDDERCTGYDVVLWIEEQVALHGFVPPMMSVHSAMSFRDFPLKAHNPKVEARRDPRDFWPKLAFLDSKWLSHLTVRL